MFEEMVYDVAEKGSFPDTCFSHNDDRNIKTYSLDHEAHLEEVIDVYDISFFAINLIVPVS